MAIRQGDVLLVPVIDPPSGTQPVAREQGRVVLAHGKATGHAHAISDERCELVTTEAADELFLLVDGAEVELLHHEHDVLRVPAGTYRVVRQREYAPGAFRRVAD